MNDKPENYTPLSNESLDTLSKLPRCDLSNMAKEIIHLRKQLMLTYQGGT